MRLDKLLGQAGFGSRGQVKKFIRSQQVRVDDELARTGNQNVDPSLQTITVSGKQLSYSPHVYYILNKPAGLVSVVRDQHYQTVIDLIAVVDRREGLLSGVWIATPKGWFLSPTTVRWVFACSTPNTMWTRPIMLRSMVISVLMRLLFLTMA